MNLPKLFSTKERIRLLSRIVYRTEPLGVNKLATELKLSKGLVSKYLDILVKEKVMKKKGNKLLVSDNLRVKSLRILLNLDNFDLNLFKKYEFIKGVGLYGSCAKGTNTETSDVDLWIKISKAKDAELAKLNNELKKFGNVKVLFFTQDKIDLLKKEDALFYHSLVFGSIILWGEGIGV